MKSSYKKILIGLLFVAAIVGYFAYQKYNAFVVPNVPSVLNDEFLHIPTGSSFDQISNLLIDKGFIKNKESFIEVAERLKYKRENMRTGRFKIEPNWNNLTLVRHLRGGKQEPVKLVLTHARMLENIAAQVARFIEPDSIAVLETFMNDEIQKKYGYTTETLPAFFIPNTYEFFWNTSAEGFMERMKKEHDAFWKKDNRTEKAKKIELTPTEVYTLASIVEKETNQNSEKKRMAGVYYNRLKIDMPLQADPTLVFATRDFAAKRVLNKHINFDSPYNTYKYTGLPPGPISMASIPSIDAVLNHEEHKYLYFCAKPDGSGFHDFAKTLSQHNVNARNYHRALNKRGQYR